MYYYIFYFSVDREDWGDTTYISDHPYTQKELDELSLQLFNKWIDDEIKIMREENMPDIIIEEFKKECHCTYFQIDEEIFKRLMGEA